MLLLLLLLLLFVFVVLVLFAVVVNYLLIFLMSCSTRRSTHWLDVSKQKAENKHILGMQQLLHHEGDEDPVDPSVSTGGSCMLLNADEYYYSQACQVKKMRVIE